MEKVTGRCYYYSRPHCRLNLMTTAALLSAPGTALLAAALELTRGQRVLPTELLNCALSNGGV